MNASHPRMRKPRATRGAKFAGDQKGVKEREERREEEWGGGRGRWGHGSRGGGAPREAAAFK